MRSPLRLIALLVLASCQLEAVDSASTSGNQAISLAAMAKAAQVRMHTRFAAARRLEEAIARSDLDRAHREARLLADLDEPDALPVWRPYLAEIRSSAILIAQSGDVITAASLTATLGQRCAQCHTAIGARVTLPAEERPADDPKLGPRMAAHQWAAARMWEGLIGPSDDRWTVGARALTAVPLTMVAQRATSTSELAVDDVARIRLYANRALALRPEESRADVFGKLLAACAHCHAELRDR